MSGAALWRIRIALDRRRDVWIALGPDRKSLTTTQWPQYAYVGEEATICATATQWNRTEGSKAIWLGSKTCVEEAT